MRILWLGRSVDLTQDAGDRIYSFNLVSAVAERPDTEVVYIGLTDVAVGSFVPPPGAVVWRPVHVGPGSALRFFGSRLPMSGARIDLREHREAIAAALAEGNWDTVVLDHYAMALALPVIEASSWRGPIVHVAHDYETQVTRDIAASFRGNLVKKVLLWANARRTTVAERSLAERCAMVTALTQKDVDSFLRLDPRLEGLAVPPGYNGAVVDDRTITEKVPKRLVAIGSFTWLAKQMNLIEFLNEADDFLHEAGIELRIIGRIPDSFSAVHSRTWKATRFLGYVDDPTMEFANARMGLVFDRTGGGFKLKMFDYIFQRLPIAGYTDALEGLPESMRGFVVEAVETRDLLEAIVATIDRVDRLQEMQVGAFATANGLFSWTSAAEAFVGTIRNLDTAAGVSTGAEGSKSGLSPRKRRR